jgi:putative transposase
MDGTDGSPGQSAPERRNQEHLTTRDNAVIESWHSTLEFELRRMEHFATKAQARAGVAAWIDDYNRDRRHSSVGMISPIDYEQAQRAQASAEPKGRAA